MKSFILLLLFNISLSSDANSSWLDDIQAENKQQQLDLRWQAVGGQADLLLMYDIFSKYGISVNPSPQFPNKHWSENHLVYPIKKQSSLSLQVPYGVIKKVTSGKLIIDANLKFGHQQSFINITSLILEPIAVFNQSDLVNFIVKDNKGHKLFTASSIHIGLDLEKQLLNMSNIDLIATNEFAELINVPYIANQVVAQLHTFNKLVIPESAITDTKSLDVSTCANNPIWPPAADVDVALINISTIAYVGDVGTDKIIVTPSASLKNVGAADVAWYEKFTGIFPPYDTDQHPYLTWTIYREVDNRFEQLALSGIKHAFFTINVGANCACPGGHVLGQECEDTYGVGNNDSPNHLGPHDELEAFTGIWVNCGSFFDPEPCNGSIQNSSNQPGQNRLVVREDELTDTNNTQMFFQAWYIIRDDINIFNSMGYRSIAPTPNGPGWNINQGPTFSSGAALDNYVTPNTISSFESSQAQNTNEGHFTVAVKVIDLGSGLYRYNYAVENYDFDPRFLNFHIPLSAAAQLSDTYFKDPDDNATNDWQFTRTNDVLNIQGNATNEQDWGMLFSFSFTTDAAPEQGTFNIDVAEPVANTTVSAPALVSSSFNFDTVFKSGFE